MDTIPQDTLVRQCTGPCGRTLPLTPEFFQRSKPHKGGFRNQCKDCTTNRSKIYRQEHPEKQKQYYESHREEKLKYHAEYNATHREEKAQYNAKYIEEHREEIKAQRVKRYAENTEEFRQRNAKNYANHAEARRAYSAKYRVEHPDIVQDYREAHRQEHRQYDREYHQEHREQKSLSSAQYRKEHAQEIKTVQDQYRQSERGRIAARAYSHIRRSRKRNAEGSHTIDDLQQQLLRQRSRCYYCHKKLGQGRNNWHVDHVVPLSRGGSNDMSNVVIACPTCNMRKKAKLLHEWPEGGRLL